MIKSPTPDAISDKQWTLLAFPYSSYDAVISEGSVRSGKTMFSIISLVDWAMNNYNGQSFAICGYSVKSVERNIIKPYMELKYAREKYDMKINHSDSVMRVSTGNTENFFYIFGGGNEASYQKVQGLTLAGAMIDEVVLLTESFVNQVLSRLSVAGSKIWFTCNPGSPTHWFYEKWVNGKWGDERQFNVLRLHFGLQDNPGLSEDALRRLTNMYEPGSLHYQRYILGEWVKAEGLVYDNFSAKKNIIKRLPREQGSEWYVAVDFGITNPFCCQLWRVDTRHSYLCDERYVTNKDGARRTVEDLYDIMRSMIGDRLVQFVVVDPSATAFKETINRRGEYDIINGVNDVSAGIETVSSMLQLGLIKILDSCENTLREFGLYEWDAKAKREQPIKENDHAMDAMRYLAHTVLRNEYDDLM